MGGARKEQDRRQVVVDVKRRSANGALDGERELDVDSGYAWVILLVIFLISASTFGTARAYGLIFERLARDDGPAPDRTSAAMPFTLMGAIENMAGPLSGYLLSRSQNSWRPLVFSGSLLIALAHFLAAFSGQSKLGQLLSMGLMCGLGLSFVTISFFQINNAYFVRYRSTAFGIGLTGAAFGTFYISPLCQYFLDHLGTDACYLMLGLILLPNVPLSLLLRPKASVSSAAESASKEEEQVESISRKLQDEEKKQNEDSQRIKIRSSITRVLKNPIFHLIWPTQLLFCWFNFVFGMIIVDLGRDRGMNQLDLGRLPPVWASGQLVGRLLLGALVDLKYFSYKTWTVVCFSLVSLIMFALNLISSRDLESDFLGISSLSTLMLTLIFTLSMFIALLYLLLNGLIVIYVEKQLQPLCIGISSFVGSFFLLPRANVIGYYRDTIGNYDAMISLFTWVALGASVAWLVGPTLGSRCRKILIDRQPVRLSSSDSELLRRNSRTLLQPHPKSPFLLEFDGSHRENCAQDWTMSQRNSFAEQQVF